MRLWWLGSIGRGGRALGLASTLLAVGAAVAVAAPGDLDTSFDGDGRVTIDYGGLSDEANDVLVQPDGKIVSVGGGNAQSDFAISRVNPDGSPDTGFDGDGTIGINFGGLDIANGVARQADGKIVAAGYTSQSDRVAVVRLNPDGGLDANFGLNGLQTIEYGGQDGAADVLVQPDGKIILAAQGGNTAPNAQNIHVTRLGVNGTPDPSFGIGGTTVLDFGGRDLAGAVALQDDGKVVVTGTTNATGGGDIVVARLNSNGSPDGSFDGEGRRTINLNASDSGEAVLVQPDGKIVVAGYREPAGGVAPVVRLEPDGSFDRSFAGGTALVPGISRIYDLALLANGKFVVAGFGPTDTGVARIQPGGSPDDTFGGGDGSVTVGAPEGETAGNAVAIQANGAIVVAGYVDTFPSPQEDNVFLARLEGDPLDTGGGPGGGGTGDGGAGGGGQGGGGPGGGPGGGGGGFTVPRCAGKRATIVGTSRKDRLRGTRRADVIVALGGNDIIKGGRSNDRICAGTGNDSIAGESGNDRIYGQSGKDKASGGSGNDRIDGGSSADRIKGQSGKDSLSGGTGNDTIDGGSSKDRINGNSGKDKCVGGSGKDRAKCERKRGI